MHPVEIHNLLLKRFTQDVPRDFLMRVNESLAAAYGLAHEKVKDFENEPELHRVLPQVRTYQQNRALREAAKVSGLSCEVQSTAPKGEVYPLVMAGDVLLGRVGVNAGKGLPRPAKYRSQLAFLNTQFEQHTGDLFGSTPQQKVEDGMGSLIVTVNPPWSYSRQDEPLGIFVGVPFSNLKGWHYYRPVEEVLAAYHQEVVQKQPDLAWAMLKRQLQPHE